MVGKLKRSAVKNKDQNRHIRIQCEWDREGGREGCTVKSRGKPLCRRGIPLLQWSAAPPTFSFLHPSPSSPPVYRCSPPAFPHTLGFSLFISLPLFFSVSVSPPSPPPSTLFVTFQCAAGHSICTAWVEMQVRLWLPPFYSSLHLSPSLPCCYSIYLGILFFLLRASKPFSPLAHLSIFPTNLDARFLRSFAPLS